MIVWPGVTFTENPYEPLVVFVMQLVVDVGIVGDVVMQAPVMGAPAESRTVPVIVIDGLALELGAGVGVCGGSVRTGVATLDGDVGTTVRAGDGDPDAGS